jgi:hypothetical protein
MTKLAIEQTRTAIEHATANIELVRHRVHDGEIPEDVLIDGLRYAASVLLQAAECLEGEREYIDPDLAACLESG